MLQRNALLALSRGSGAWRRGRGPLLRSATAAAAAAAQQQQLQPQASSSHGGPRLLNTELVEKVAVVSLLSPEGKLPWGTRLLEHRINPLLIKQLHEALDSAEQEGAEALVVIGEGQFFCNGMDLQYISAHVAESTKIQADAEVLLRRILTLGMPTIAAINGHFAAAGAMLGLAFDLRIMPSDGRGLMFVPGIDIGLVYSAGMTELMKAKMPQVMWNGALCFGQRFPCAELLQHGVVNAAPPLPELRSKALETAQMLRSKGRDEKTRQTMHGIKQNLYREAVVALGRDVQDMGFAGGTWDGTGRAAKL